MDIVHRDVLVSDLIKDYKDSQELGVFGYGGKLNIRPAYQREFIYKEKQRNAVIDTVRRNYPLNTMYWAVSGDGFELMDGQQRTISICQYVTGDYSVDVDGTPMFFDNLPKDKKQQILDYKLSIYICEGTDSEKLDWFKTINIAGEKLTDQELRNAIFAGPWLSDAKRWFSRTAPPAMQEGRDKLVNGSPIRQDILETALSWLSGGKDKIEDYMGKHQSDPDADELWQYWQRVFAWVKQVFPNQDSARAKLMKGAPWGLLYNAHKDDKLNAQQLEARIVTLIDDDEVENKRGIYEYLLTGSEKYLNLRAFDEKTKQKKYAEQKGICPVCKKHFDLDGMEADHVIPWHEGGKTEYANCQLLCRMDNRMKSGK